MAEGGRDGGELGEKVAAEAASGQPEPFAVALAMDFPIVGTSASDRSHWDR